MVLSMTPAELKTLPLESALYADAIPLCALRLSVDGLCIEPSANARIALQGASANEVVGITGRWQRKAESRSGASFWLHLGAVNEEHVVWRFNW